MSIKRLHKETIATPAFQVPKLYQSSFANLRKTKAKPANDCKLEKPTPPAILPEPTKTMRSKSSKAKIKESDYFANKVCEVCQNSLNESKLYLCEVCDDAYHSYCCNFKRELKKNEDFYCEKCKLQIAQMKKKSVQLTLENTIIDIPKTPILFCGCCNKQLLTNALYCGVCKKGFHDTCIKGELFCSKCDSQIEKNKELVSENSKINDYFSIIKRIQTSPNRIDKLIIQNNTTKKPTFKLPKYKEEENKAIMMESLQKALLSKGYKFDDELYFPLNHCPPSSNDASLEPYCQQMPTEDLKIFSQFKEITKTGLYAPVKIINDSIQGCIVIAIESITRFTLICEYTGDVLPLRLVLFDKNDSIMQLLHAQSSALSLAIVPQHRANLARFISGVNNEDNSKSKKQNVKSIRYNINGHIRVILYACKDIKKGATLYYDYNEGGLGHYPTKEFI